MIQFEIENNAVKIKISLSIGYNITTQFVRDCEMDAVLLRNQITQDLDNKIESIRREAYNLGWKEARSKKATKKTWFNGNINSNVI